MADEGTATPAEPAAETSAPAEPTAEATNGEAAPTNGEAAPAEPWREMAHKIKLEGEELEVSYQDLLDGHMRQKSYTKKTQALAEERRKVQAVINALENEPGEVLRRLGPKAVEHSLAALINSSDPVIQSTVQGFFQRLIEESQLPPEERTKRQLAEERKRLEAERGEFESKRKQERIAAKTAEYEARYDQWFRAGLEAVNLAESGQDPSPYLVVRMATAYESLIDSGQPDDPETVSKAAALVQAEYEAERQSLLTNTLGSLEPEKLAELLGNERLRALREREIAKVAGSKIAPVEPAAPPPKPKAPTKPMSTDEWRRQREAKRRGG